MNNLIVAILATYRLTSMLHSERGPFDIFEKLRELIGIEHVDHRPEVYPPDSFWCGLFECPWCLSVWVAFLPTALVLFAKLPWWNYPLIWLAYSAGACVIWEVVAWLDRD